MGFSKARGCPIGSMLVGPQDLIDSAWSVRKRLGGGMRQVGILAAAALWSLDHVLPGLADDHARAARLAEACRQIDGLAPVEPDTNILMIDITRPGIDAAGLACRLEEHGVLLLPAGPTRVRAVTHFDVDDADVLRAIEGFRNALS
jgi:threonine aldolase